MSAPENAQPIAPKNLDVDGNELGSYSCECCGAEGRLGDLLGVDDDDTLWCPVCRTSSVIF